MNRNERRLARLVAGVFSLALALVPVVYWDSFEAMTELWSTESYHHAILVPPISAYFLYARRHTLATIPISGTVTIAKSGCSGDAQAMADASGSPSGAPFSVSRS